MDYSLDYAYYYSVIRDGALFFLILWAIIRLRQIVQAIEKNRP